MPDALTAILIAWGSLAAFGLMLGGGLRYVALRSDVRDIRIAYLIMLAGLAAPVAVPFWIGYGIRAAILDYRRNVAELRELAEADPEPDNRPRPTLPDPGRR